MKYDEHMRAIGVATVNFAALEEYLSDFITKLINEGDQVGQAITAELSFKQLVNVLGSLHRVKSNDSAKIKELDTILKRAFALEQERNLLMHSWWNWSREPGQIARVKHTAKRKLKSNAESMAAQDIWNISNKISKLSNDLMRFMSL